MRGGKEKLASKSLTRPSLTNDVISHWRKNFCFYILAPFLQILFLWVALKLGTVDLMFLIGDLILLMMIL